MRRLFATTAVPVLLLAAIAVHAEEEPIGTDRPDFVESSNVVGKGRAQLELGLSVERDSEGDFSERATTTPFLLRVGIAGDWELRLETDGRVSDRVTVAGDSQTTTGFSDVALGLKWHTTDGAGNAPSTALLLHVDVDSGSSAFRGEGLRPSLRGVAEWELPGDMGVGVMPGIVYDQYNEHRFVSGIFAVTFGKQWTEHLRTFVEVAGQQFAHAEDGGNIITYDAGATWLLNNDMQLDISGSLAANNNTPDSSFGVGYSVRF